MKTLYDVVLRFDDNQPRDDHGRWTSSNDFSGTPTIEGDIGASVLAGKSTAEILALAGVTKDFDSAGIRVRESGEVRVWAYKLAADSKHELAHVRRTIGKDSIENNSFEIHAALQGSGFGTRVFAHQVDAAASQGFKTIETRADKAYGINGYYVWARLGYDADLSEVRLLPDRPNNLSSATRVSDLMKTSEGRSWWKENGRAFDGVFDLKTGSSSREVLSDYMKSKEKKTYKAVDF